MSLKPSGTVGFGSGELAGTPGYRPLNPWGRPFPKHLVNKQPRPALWQIVAMRNGKETAIFPKMPKDAAEMLYRVVDQSIRSGAEKEFSHPRMVCVESDSSLKERRLLMPNGRI